MSPLRSVNFAYLTHVHLLDNKEDCAICERSWSDSHSYHVIGMKPESIFLSTNSIIQHLAHWRERNEWFRKGTITVSRRKLWHGKQFCNATISTEQIEERWGMNPLTRQFRTITCSECLDDNLVEIRYAGGNPPNQVFIFREDSFNAFFKRIKKVADGCVLKINRGETKQSFTFCNSCILPEGVVHKMGLFLKPLIDEAKTHCVEGFDVRILQDIDINGYTVIAGVHQVRLGSCYYLEQLI